jgi:hypothetical protein
MRTKILVFLLAACVLCVASWFVHVPTRTHADEVPEKYRDTVHNGLQYLVNKQQKDGHWEGDDGKHPVAMTGLVGLALLMERKNPPRSSGRVIENSKYADNVRKAAEWLMDKSQPKRDGLIYADHASETSRYMQGHGFATLFLAGAYRDEHDETRRKKLNDVLTAAVKYIVKAQSSQGGWYDTSKVEGHDFDSIAATVIQLQALQAAENAGIPVPSDTMADAKEYLKNALRKYEEMPKPVLHVRRQIDTAGALACLGQHERFGRGEGVAKDELREKSLTFCRTAIPTGPDIKFGRDELVHYYYAQTVVQLDGKTWSAAYRTAVFDHLQSGQKKDGSWPGSDGISTGPVYATALWCTILQLDNRSHPSRPRDVQLLETTLRRDSRWAHWFAMDSARFRPTRC